MNKYDEFLKFNLPKDYYFLTEKDDEGKPLYKIKAGKSKNDDGEDTYENVLQIANADAANNPFSVKWKLGAPLKGILDAYFSVASNELKVLVFTVTVFSAVIWIKKEDHVYALTSNKAFREGVPSDEWISFLNNVLSSVEIEGVKGDFEKLTVDMIKAANAAAEEEAVKNSAFPLAKPEDGQHTHLDFLNKSKASASIFGGLLSVNQTGTEYSFESVAEMADVCDSSELSSLYREIAEAKQDRFDLAETAHDMAELFRVNADVFDSAHDREQEILNGYIQRATVYQMFRSFAWTFAAYCNKERIDPAAVDFDTIHDIIDFIGQHDGLNYTPNSFAPALCSGDDLHVYYIPDSVSESSKKKLLNIVNVDDDPIHISETKSLNGLRADLTYIYPAIKAIYDELEKNRDREEPLQDGAADILYAWCAMAYAAREPFFSEDGPVNCWWEHPDNAVDWETQWKIDNLESAINQEKEWIKKHNKDVSRNTPISFQGKTFVFAGVEGLEEWLSILQKLTDLGGVQRGAVSGKTDYLVCNPMYAGESKVKHAIEQRIKGKDVKIVLFDDFLKAIKMTIKSPKEQLDELKAGKEMPAEKHIKPVERPESKKKERPENFTYHEGLKASGEDYVLEVPDGFRIQKDVEGRDFIAYIPSADDPEDYVESRFIIYAGQKQENNLFGQLRTIPEFQAVIQGISGSLKAAFADSKVVRYDRRDLPGAIVYGYDPGCLHANAYVGVGDHMQTMRLQIAGVDRQNKTGYEEIVTEMLDHMTTDTPVQLLKPLDSEEFVAMSKDGKAVKEWAECINDYVTHISISRSIEQNGIVTIFKQQQQRGSADVSQLKRDIKALLRSTSKYAEAELIKAEAVYVLKRSQYPDSKMIGEMRKAMDPLIDLTNQTVELNGEPITITSEVAARIKDRLDAPVAEAIRTVLGENSDALDLAIRNALTMVGNNIKTDPTEELAAVEKAKQEEEKQRLEKEKAQREKEEAERKAAEEKARKEREEAEKKATEERARKEREEAEKKRKAEEEKRRKEEECLKAAEVKAKRPERIKYLEYASRMMSTSLYALAYVKPDGTVGSFSNYSNIGGKGAPGDTSSFSNIKSIVCTEDGIVGLRNNGTCIATKPGFTYAYIGECNKWKDIVAIAAGDHQVVGLKKDGTCVANTIKWNTGYGYDGQSNVSGWRDIVALACFDNISMGLRSDGTVALACTDEFAKVESVTEWQNVEMIAAGYQSAVGLTKDGKLLKTPKVSVSDIDPKKGIVRLMIHCGQAYALYVDGTVGGGTKGNSYGMNSTPMIKEKNVIAMASNNNTIFVLTEDGRIHTYNQGFLLKTPDDIRIFDSYARIMGERKLEEERMRMEAEEAAQKQAEEDARRAERKAQGVCPYCGGTFKKGFLSTKCTSCGRKKDY